MTPVSVILPIRNSERTLARAIDSVLVQTYGELELICVVNGSTDASENIVKDYCTKDQRVKLFQSSPGIVPAMNTALWKSSFDLIAVQNADDLWYPKKLEKQVAFMSSNLDVDILGTQIRCVDKNLNPTEEQLYRPVSDADIKMTLLRGWGCIANPSVLYRKKIMERLGGYDSFSYKVEDYNLWLRAIPWYKFANLKEILVDYTVAHDPSWDDRVSTYLCSVYRALYDRSFLNRRGM